MVRVAGQKPKEKVSSRRASLLLVPKNILTLEEKNSSPISLTNNIHFRKNNVQNHQVKLPGGSELITKTAIAGNLDLVSKVPEVDLDQLADIWIIFDYEYFFICTTLLMLVKVA